MVGQAVPIQGASWVTNGAAATAAGTEANKGRGHSRRAHPVSGSAASPRPLPSTPSTPFPHYHPLSLAFICLCPLALPLFPYLCVCIIISVSSLPPSTHPLSTLYTRSLFLPPSHCIISPVRTHFSSYMHSFFHCFPIFLYT